MKRVVALVVLLFAGACSGQSVPKDQVDALCRFASAPLTSGIQARQLAADIQQALPKGMVRDVTTVRISTAVLKLMTAAGSAVPTSAEEAMPDAALVQAVQAQAELAAACA